MYSGPGAVLRRWLRPPFSADGWRIDVANMLGRLGPDQLGPEVARGIRAAVKAENPDAYLIGEHSFDGTHQLAGDEWDGVMNYAGFTWPVVGWLNGTVYESHGVGVILRTGRGAHGDLIDRSRPSAPPWRRSRAASTTCSTATTRPASGVGRWRSDASGGVRCSLLVGVPSSCVATRSGSRDRMVSARDEMPWDQANWDSTASRSCARHPLPVRSRALMIGGFRSSRQATTALLPSRHRRGAGHRRRHTRPSRPPIRAVAAGAVADRTAFVELFSGARAGSRQPTDIGTTPAGVRSGRRPASTDRAPRATTVRIPAMRDTGE
jgi:alpha-glucosidase